MEDILDALIFKSQPLIYVINGVNILTYVDEGGGLFVSCFNNIIYIYIYIYKHRDNKKMKKHRNDKKAYMEQIVG
jgi:hypothetical protein